MNENSLKTGVYFGIPIVFFAGLGISLQNTVGAYGYWELLFVSVFWLIVCVLAFLPKNLSVSLAWNSSHLYRILTFVVAFLLIMTAKNPMVTRQDAESYSMMCNAQMISAAIAIALCSDALIAWKSLTVGVRKRATVGYSLIAVLLFAGMIYTLKAVPQPYVDVFVANTLGADYLLNGQNPYVGKYPDIYHGFYDYVPGYVYWPGVLYIQTLAKAIFGDVRYATIIAEFITVLSLRKILKLLKWDPLFRNVIPILWLSFPVSFFVLQQSWVDPLLICAAVLVVLFLTEKKMNWAAVALGYFCAIKQYSVFFSFLVGVYVLLRPKSEGAFGATLRDPKSWNWKEFTRFVGISGAVFFALVLPFALWDWDGFYFNTVSQLLSQKMRMDSLSLIAGFARSGIMISGMQILIVYLVAVVSSVYWIATKSRSNQLQTLTSGLIVTYGATFLFGKQAFCNYYYLLSFFVLLNLFVRPAPSMAPPRRGAS
jgi:hypothetical protein